MSYESYSKEMDELQKQYDEAVQNNDWNKCDLIQKRMNRLTENTTRIADANLRSKLKGWY